MPEFDDFRGGATSWASSIGDSILRENWTASPGPADERQRRYDPTALYRLAIIQCARQLGFTLTEIRHLFLGFRDITRASERWRTLSQRKLVELDDLMEE